MKRKFIIGLVSFLSLVTITACGMSDKGKQSSSGSISTSQSKKHKSENISSITKKSRESSTENIKSSTSIQQSSTVQSESTQTNVENNDYYLQIKNAWQKAKDYVDSITDPHIKQGVQTPESAAISESSLLLAKHPEDATIINESLHKVLSGQ